MKTYYIDYISSTDHDVCHVWTEANSADEARSEVESEYWDIEEIISVREGKCYETRRQNQSYQNGR